MFFLDTMTINHKIILPYCKIVFIAFWNTSILENKRFLLEMRVLCMVPVEYTKYKHEETSSRFKLTKIIYNINKSLLLYLYFK